MREYSFTDMTLDEQGSVNGGFIETFLLIGGIAAGWFAIYEAGKATGEFIAECIK